MTYPEKKRKSLAIETHPEVLGFRSHLSQDFVVPGSLKLLININVNFTLLAYLVNLLYRFHQTHIHYCSLHFNYFFNILIIFKTNIINVC